MTALRVASVVAVAASGCASLVEIEDAQQHLPRLDGTYLVAIARDRPNPPGGAPDVVRLRGEASLDPETRTFTFSAAILQPLPGTGILSETSISNVVFPDDSDEVEVTLVLSIPDGAVEPPPVSGDSTINTPVRFIAEADYSFCAKPVPGERVVTLGSYLIPEPSALPMDNDTSCDDELRP